jgi:hypothetical protein
MDYEVLVGSTDEDVVLAAVAKKLAVTVRRLNPELRDEIKDELSDAMDDATEQDKEDAQKAIDDADDAIDDAQILVTAAPAGEKKEAAQDLLDDAKAKLVLAEDEFDDEDYENAKKTC